MEIHLQDIIISIINIVVLYLLLRLILWKHVNRYLSERTNRIRDDIDSASKIRQEAEDLRTECNEKIAGLEERGLEIVQESRIRAGEESEKIINNAKAVVDDMMREAELRIEKSKEQALKDAHADIAQLATEMAVRILRREVSAVDNAHAVDEFFHEVD